MEVEEGAAASTLQGQEAMVEEAAILVQAVVEEDTRIIVVLATAVQEQLGEQVFLLFLLLLHTQDFRAVKEAEAAVEQLVTIRVKTAMSELAEREREEQLEGNEASQAELEGAMEVLEKQEPADTVGTLRVEAMAATVVLVAMVAEQLD